MVWRPRIIGACSVTTVAVLCLLQFFTRVNAHEVAERVEQDHSFGQHQQMEILVAVEARGYLDR